MLFITQIINFLDKQMTTEANGAFSSFITLKTKLDFPYLRGAINTVCHDLLILSFKKFFSFFLQNRYCLLNSIIGKNLVHLNSLFQQILN